MKIEKKRKKKGCGAGIFEQVIVFQKNSKFPIDGDGALGGAGAVPNDQIDSAEDINVR